MIDTYKADSEAQKNEKGLLFISSAIHNKQSVKIGQNTIKCFYLKNYHSR